MHAIAIFGKTNSPIHNLLAEQNTHEIPFSLTIRLQKFESDSEDDDTITAVASPMICVKEELTIIESAVPSDIEMFSSEDVGNNVTICHDAEISDQMDGSLNESQTNFGNNTI